MAQETRSTEQAALTLEIDPGGVAWLVFDDPDRKLNVLTTPVMERLDELLGELEQAVKQGRARAAVFRSGKDGSFIAGASVDEIAAITDPAEGRRQAARGQAIFQRIHKLEIPTIAAIDGICLGGGTELALACDVRLATDRKQTRIGLPEVQLGILPGFGGTTRLPRLIGLVAASDLILTGRAVDARKAEKIGLVHERMHPGVLVERARELAEELAEGKEPPSAGPGLVQKAAAATGIGRRVILAQARKTVLKKTGGKYPAPLRIIDVLRESAGEPLETALDIEADAIGELIATEESKNLIHVFHLMEDAKKAAPAAEPKPVERVAVLGAGVMGGGVAQLLSYRGVSVLLKDIDRKALSAGLRHARKQFDTLIERRKLRRHEAETRMNAISPTLEYAGFGTIDLVIEAVVERMDVKKAVLRETEAAVSEDAVLTTNTSSLPITAMQEALERPERFAGMHFFNPVHRMPLVEIIRGERSSEETIATVFALARKLDKTPVIVNDGPGFLVNRILTPYLNEAGFLLAEGASIAEIDEALVDFGMPMGPLRLLDEVGFDVARHAGETMHDAFGARLEPSPVLRGLEHGERLGRKNDRGFYVYEDGREKHPDPSVYDELRTTITDDRHRIAPRVIQDRAILPMVNEAARVLEAGIARSPGDVDVAMITGTGFPPFRGGLLRYADRLGLRAVLAKLESFEREHGVRFQPAPLLRARAEAGAGFYD